MIVTGTRPLQSGEHALIGAIIGASFADDPVNRWVFRDPRGMAAFYRLVAKKLYLRRGFGHVCGDAGGSLWLPPGVDKNIPLWNSLDTAVAMIRYGGPGAIARGLAVDSFLAGRRPAAPHYYLYAIGARPSRQGAGIGGRLMAAGLEPVDRDRMPAYLESSKESNVGFYRRFGFRVTERIVPARDCPPMWLMWREAGG
jgi:ribosomal protein S18 acetylase RimI-like enzyme